MLHPLRKEWMMVFAPGAREALNRLSETAYDVLVTGMLANGAPDFDGIELLTQSTQLYPQMVRIVLSGAADPETTLRSVTLAHQYLMKPYDTATLLSTLEDALTLRNIVDDPFLTAVIGRIRSLPGPPAVSLKLIEAVQSAATSTAEVGEIVGQDLGMSRKVLQWASSPLFACKRTIASPKEAAIHLGCETVKALALTESVFSQFDGKHTPGFSVEELRSHSLRVATMAREIAQTRGLPGSVRDDVFLGGLLHDIGKVVLGCNLPRQYREVVRCFQDPEAAHAAERRIFGTTHAEVGGYLLWLWGFPRNVTEIVVRHHTAGPETGEVLDPAGVVSLADELARQGYEHAADCDLDFLPGEVA